MRIQFTLSNQNLLKINIIFCRQLNMKNELVTFINEVDDLDVEEFEVVVKNRTKQKETKWQAFKKAFKSLFCCCCCNEKYRPRSV